MNEKFFELSAEKQNKIINAGLHIHAKYDYKKASIDDIAKLAEVSKPLIFHYFENKKGFYLFLYHYATEFVIKSMKENHDFSENDFFKILVQAQCAKIAMLSKHPDIMMYILKAYFEESEEVKDCIDKRFSEIISSSSQRFLARADISKFKADVSPEKVLNIILWASEGFMRSRTPNQLANLQSLNKEYLEHLEEIRKLVYKPEYIYGGINNGSY